jgi:hypothetical protein
MKTKVKKSCECGSTEFTSIFGPTYEKEEVEIFTCKKCGESYIKEKVKGKVIFLKKNHFPK